jgi:hypothetical protein
LQSEVEHEGKMVLGMAPQGQLIHKACYNPCLKISWE